MRNFCDIFLYCFVALLFTFVTPQVVFGQLGADLSSTDNSQCNGAPCDYDGPSIIINELMMSPTSNDGSLWGGNANQRGEWIELYNPNICEPVDISCFYLGNNANDGGPYPGGYVIPAGTVVPAAGFALIRGVNAAPVPANLLIENGGNVVELVVDGAGVCVGGGNRLWFPNAGGWFAFYDSNGIPQDAVSWANQSNTDQFPCIPTSAGCGFSGMLSNYDNFPAQRKNYILNTSAADFQGQSIRRMPDGAGWSGVGVPTYATNNAPPPIPPIIICNGTAIAQPSGGNPPYTYLWDDPQNQTTSVATDLCAGEYCVTITDASNNVFQQCVTVEDEFYEEYISAGICQGESYTLPDNSVVTLPGDYPVLLQSEFLCDSLITVNLEVYPTYSFELNPQICDNQTYTLPDGSIVDQTGTYQVTFQTDFGCDSVYTIDLLVTNPIGVTIDEQICEGATFILPDGTETSDEGLYEILIPGEPGFCDTLFTVNLAFYPDFEINVDTVNDISCFGEVDGAIALSATGSSGPYAYAWSDGIDHGANAENLQAGDYSVVVSDANGCVNDTSLNISEPLPIQLALFGDSIICSGSSTVVVTSVTGGTGSLSYMWNPDIFDTPIITVSPEQDAIYRVYATDENGCVSETEEIAIAVISMDSGLLTVSNDTTVCPGAPVSIFGSYEGPYPPYDYNWSGGLANEAGTHIIAPDAPTAFVLSVSDICGNMVSEEVVVNHFDTPEAIVPDALINGCSPLAVELIDTYNTDAGYSHEWISSDGNSYEGNPANFVLDEPGVYEFSLVVTSPEGCTATSETTMPIEVYEMPFANFSASAWNMEVGDSEITFTDISTGQMFNNWTIEGVNFENMPEVEYAFADTGSYPIYLLVENEFGCRDSLTQWVNVGIGHDIEVPNAFIPAGGSGDDPYYDPTSTTNTVFYPFADYVKDYKMSIFNRWGELIFESTEQEMGWNGTYRDQPCPQDVYVYKIELVYADGKKATKVGDVTLFR